MTRIPSAAPSNTFPVLSKISKKIPGRGFVAEPGFKTAGLVARGSSWLYTDSAEINIPPVSVCHQVSTTGHLPSPTTS